MPTDCISNQVEFEGFDGRKVIAGFDGGAITSDAGTLLLRHTASGLRQLENKLESLFNFNMLRGHAFRRVSRRDVGFLGIS